MVAAAVVGEAQAQDLKADEVAAVEEEVGLAGLQAGAAIVVVARALVEAGRVVVVMVVVVVVVVVAAAMPRVDIRWSHTTNIIISSSIQKPPRGRQDWR